MILELEIKNFAILQGLRLELGPGLNVFTGETGAGKTLLLRAIDFLLGGSSETHGEVQGVFRPSPEAKEMLLQDGFEFEDEIYISRESKSGSRSVSRINGTLVPIAKIKTLAPKLVEIQAQHSHHALLDPKSPLLFLDAFGGDEITERKNQVSRLVCKWSECVDEKRNLEERAKDRERNIDLARYEVTEIENAKLAEGEEEELRMEREKLGRIEKLRGSLAEALALVEQAELTNIEKHLERLVPFDNQLNPWLTKLREMSYEWADFRDALKSSNDRLSADPARLEQIVDRLDLIHRFQKKYGATIPEILNYAASRKAELSALESLDDNLKALASKIKVMEASLEQSCAELSNLRKKSADQLTKLMEKELTALNVPRAKFEVQLTQLPQWTQTGKDEAQFLVSMNPGEGLKPLAKVASGGELSRMMLALRVILGANFVPTSIFDEVDAGLGGETAFHVAERLQKLAKNRQALCVTHLHQVASLADHHFALQKQTARGKTSVIARKLNDEEKIHELARMMAGKRKSEAAVQHAEELLKSKKTH